ncbi:serine hydrolase domain-containing protein [Bacillus horti]|uniref:CubicO group peptidase (Beta-lactamase class C family) n=1 Tax=Caldalkalibacillus horti TaxID=77523 RepID=A0ABT9W0U3_9BACI|nr:serine hydrolase domain-containing protein [Bacillus horti]MDQ0166826.1 CubicO group peptidase (beta-lactamase class C family) [Bacillus horti]
MKSLALSKAFEEHYQKTVEKHQIPGIVLGLATKGGLREFKSIGYRDYHKRLPFTPDTVIGIGSVTKSFTCIAIMQLQEQGKLSVHDPVVKYLPEFKTPNEEYTQAMTIHHFMTHSAGLPPLPSLFGAMRRSLEKDIDPKPKDPDKPDPFSQLPYIETYEELMVEIAKGEYELLGEPGKQFSYSNDCYALLGAIIERVSGVTYEDYLKQNVLEPAGMKNSVFHLEELDGHEDIASIYNKYEDDGKSVIYESNNPWDAPSMRAAGFLKSTVNDMIKYGEIFQNNGKVGDQQILTPESMEAIMTPHIQCEYNRYYGYGVMITPDFFGYKLIDHGGSIKGVAAQFNVLPELGITGISLTNLSGVPSTTLLQHAYYDLLEQPLDDSHYKINFIELSEDELNEYGGTYVSGEGASYTVQLEDGELIAVIPEQGEMVLKPFGDGWFFTHLRDMALTARFFRDEENKVFRLSLGFRLLNKLDENEASAQE